MITESNEEISGLVYHLEKKIIQLKQKYPKSLVLVEFRNFQLETILPWMESYLLDNIEVNIEYDELMKNQILDMINYINRLL